MAALFITAFIAIISAHAVSEVASAPQDDDIFISL
jgi:hypothetical protein